MRSLSIAPRDQLVLSGLGQQVRLLGQRQLAEAFWSGDIANARRRLRLFVEMGWVDRHTAHARPLPELLAPVLQWQPGKPEPNLARVAFLLQSRWKYRQLRTTVVYTPSKSLIEHFGGRPKRPLPTQVSHDLGVAAVWLWYCQHRPNLIDSWRSEDTLTDLERGESTPDAVLVNAANEPVVWIEFGGDYATDRLAAFHDSAAGRGVSYQIW